MPKSLRYEKRLESRQLSTDRRGGLFHHRTLRDVCRCTNTGASARLVYGALDERAGAVESRFRVCDTDFLNHRIEVTAGVLEQECRRSCRTFFVNGGINERMNYEG